MAENENIGGISVDVVAKYAELQDDLAGAQKIAADAGEKIAEALNAGAEGADKLTTAVEAVATAAEAFAGQVDAAAQSSQALGQSMVEAGGDTASLSDRITALQEALADASNEELTAGERAEALTSAIGALGVNLEDVVAAAEAAGGSTEAYDQALQSAIESALEAAGGITGVSDAMTQAGAGAQEAAAQLSLFDDAMNVPYADEAGQLNLFATELEPIPEAAGAAADALGNMGEETQRAGQSAGEAAPELDSASTATQGLVEQVVQLGVALEFTDKLVEFGKAALEAADEVDDATYAIGLLGGSAGDAEIAVAQLRDVAKDDALGMPEILKAAQRMTNFLGSAQPVPGIMRQLADAAAAMHAPLSATSAAFEKIIASGEISTKSLQKLGLKLDDVAEVMNTTADKAKKAFAELDQSKQLAVMQQALEKFDGAAKHMADDSLGALARAGLAWSEVLEEIGKAIEPVVKAFADFTTSEILPFVKALAEQFAALPEPVKNVATGVTLLAAAIVPITAAVGGVQLAFGALKLAIVPAIEAIAGIGGAITGATASYGAMVAAGFFTIGVWIALAGAVLELVNAYMKMKAAEKDLADASKLQQDNLSSLEINLKRQGAQIDDIAKQYRQGALSWTEYMQKLRDVSIELGKNATAHKDAATAVTYTATAVDGARIKQQSLKDAVASTYAEFQKAAKTYKETGQGADEAAKAYDKWQSATKALQGAHAAALPVVEGFAKATREFNAASLEFPKIAEISANAVEGERIKMIGLQEALSFAQQNLAQLIARYNDHNATAAQVAAAVDKVTSAQKALAAAWTAAEPPVAKMREGTTEIEHQRAAIAALLPPLMQVPAPVRDATFLLSQMGAKGGEAASVIRDKLLTVYDELAGKQHTIEQEKDAWDLVSKSIRNVAAADLPAVIQAYNTHISQLVALHATQQEILNAREEELSTEIRLAEQTGASATSQIVALENVRIKQQALYDSTHALGQLYVDVIGDILKGYDQIGGAVADAIVDGGKLGKAMEDIGKQVVKSIIQDWINAGLKQLKTALVNAAGDVANLGKEFTKLGKTITDALGTGQSATKGLSTGGMGGGAGVTGALGAAGAIASIGNLISSLIGNFQMAKLETTMNAVEHNTRFSEIVQEQFKADQWEQHAQLLTKLDLLINETRSQSYSLAQAILDGFKAMGGVGSNADIIQAIREGFNVELNDTAAIVGMIRDASTGLGSIISGGVNAITTALISGFQGTINTLLGVKKYHSGGVVTETGLAMLQAGEVVVPTSDVGRLPALPSIPEFRPSMSSPQKGAYSSAATNNNVSMGGVTFNIYGATDPRETTRAVANTLKQVSPAFAVYQS